MSSSETVGGGRYVLEELLGRGGMSEVWRAHDRELGRRVAIKLLAPNADTARFEREARAVASLAHPNITQLYDYGEERGRPFMVLEYLLGGTLEDRLRAGAPLPDGESGRVAAGIAAGLAHAHARGVVHRDLKPANVLFDEEGRPKLADFGIARLAAGGGTLTEAGTVLGTAAYISPEQAAGAPASAASDVYSFGVILFRMLTGRLPFESSDPMELVLLHRDSDPPPLASLRHDAPAALAAATTAALAKDARSRPPNGQALVDLLDPAAAPDASAQTVLPAEDATRVLPPARAEPPPPAPPPPPAHRARALLASATLLVLAVTGAAVAYALTRSSSSNGDSGTFTAITLPSQSRTARTTGGRTTTAPTTSAARSTTTTSTTAQTTTRRTTTSETTAQTSTYETTAAQTSTAQTTAAATTATTATTTAPASTGGTTTASPPTTGP